MSQNKYVSDLLDKYNMTDCKISSTPMEVSNKITKSGTSLDTNMKKFPFRSLVVSLMYLAVATRPDIAFAVSSLSQFNNCYDESHWKAAKRILKYLKGTQDTGLQFKKTGSTIEGFADADWGSCQIDRRSYSGYLFVFGGAAVAWEARKQRTVALSSVEAEYLSLTDAAKEATYLKRLYFQITHIPLTVVIKNDSQGAQRLAKNPIHHSRTKHIDIRQHFIRQCINNGDISLDYLATDMMPADFLTKPVSRDKHWFCCDQAGLTSG